VAQKEALDIFRIAEQKCSEMAYLAGFFFSPLGEKLFYVCMIIYLYGDLCKLCPAIFPPQCRIDDDGALAPCMRREEGARAHSFFASAFGDRRRLSSHAVMCLE
jgi:hypothetical protein